ncbi:uncharacterized protein LOC114526085 [Dendronephthya gigantea]|uniref:uncharacterized protein LOC114526085 n=1 Tax=Dendronephthya gigantea TaxID=151771 RepID=UPI00106D02BF|nr:uncharacterized protein LOC114526085 [Dendronephthya gigantea]
MTVTPTPDKIMKTEQGCMLLLNKQNPTIQELAEVIGVLVANFPGVEFGPSHYRNLEKDKVLALSASKGSYQGHVNLSKKSREELQWWLDNIATSQKHITHGKPSITIQTDASKAGWGAACSEKNTGGRWSAAEQEQHINALELRAAFFGLKAFCPGMGDNHVRLELDNTTAIAYIKNMGGSKSEDLNQLACELWDWCITRNIWVSAAHIPGVHNIIADRRSRQFKDEHEWQLNKLYFQQILINYPNINVDLFASRLNHQLENYASWEPDPYYGPSDRNIGGPTLADSGMVHTPVAIIAQSTMGPRPASRHDVEPSTVQNTPNPKAKADSMPCIRESLANFQLSEEVTQVIMSSWRSNTKKQYHTYITKWLDFCHQRQGNPYKPELSQAMNFLQTLYNAGLSYSAINTARSALSTIINIHGSETFGTHPLVSRYLKGVFLTRKPVPKYNTVWDVDKVLTYLKTLTPNKEIPLKELTLKLVMLLSLVTAQRGQSIVMLDITGMTLTESSCTFQLLEHTKTSRPGNSGQCIRFSRFTPDAIRISIKLQLTVFIY